MPSLEAVASQTSAPAVKELLPAASIVTARIAPVKLCLELDLGD